MRKTDLRIVALILILGLCGCGEQRRRNVADLAANIYAAAEAQQAGADVQATATAIRLQAEEIANRQGYTIEGYNAWKASLPTSPLPAGSPTPPVP